MFRVKNTKPNPEPAPETNSTQGKPPSQNFGMAVKSCAGGVEDYL